MFDDIRRELDTTREMRHDSFGSQKAIQFRFVVVLVTLVLWKRNSLRNANALLKRFRVKQSGSLVQSVRPSTRRVDLGSPRLGVFSIRLLEEVLATQRVAPVVHPGRPG